jgi:hypothetical protein
MGRSHSDHFFHSNDDCSAQDRPRELKLVLLELSGNEDSEYVLKFFQHVWVCVMAFGGHFGDEPDKCEHVWGTAHRESVNFRGSSD